MVLLALMLSFLRLQLSVGVADVGAVVSGVVVIGVVIGVVVVAAAVIVLGGEKMAQSRKLGRPK